ncbi:MAG: geranylgeranylglyceryl/heptaprenylglyceryl phosphate synthase [Flavobacteriales bacterium]
MNNILHQITARKGIEKKSLAVLMDPDKLKDEAQLINMMSLIEHSGVDFIFVGGSLLVEDNFHACVKTVKQHAKVPVVLFPGSPSQISNDADAILFLSLISGRNPELLIGHHVAAAPLLKQTNLEIIPTGYMLVDCGKQTTASYISQTLPLPYDKPEIAAATAMAGEMLGLRCMYLDGGSGAQKPISTEMISAVRESVSTPLIVGGGIRNEEQAAAAFSAGADLIVVGTAFEEEPELLFALANTRSAN